MKKQKPFELLYALYDRDGCLTAVFDTREEAEQDAWGPRFRGATIRVYRLVPRARERDDSESCARVKGPR